MLALLALNVFIVVFDGVVNDDAFRFRLRRNFDLFDGFKVFRLDHAAEPDSLFRFFLFAHWIVIES